MNILESVYSQHLSENDMKVIIFMPVNELKLQQNRYQSQQK